MARIGMKYNRYCRVDITQNADGTETETLREGKVMGKAISANITLNIPESIQYGDDGPAETVREFISGTIEVVSNDLPDEVEADILGLTLDEDGVMVATDADEPPYVRHGYMRTKVTNGKRKYVGICYMRVKYSPSNDQDQTKGESIELRGESLTGTILRNANGEWRRKKTFDTLDEATAWLNKMCNIPAVAPVGG